MSDDLDEIERLAREATNPRPWMAHHVAHALHSHLTPARVLALVARLRRAERVVEAAKAADVALDNVTVTYSGGYNACRAAGEAREKLHEALLSPEPASDD
jgi:predicted N-acetyltransferase YhbS